MSTEINKTSAEKILFRLKKINDDFVETLTLHERVTVVNMLGQLVGAQAAEEQAAAKAKQDAVMAQMQEKMEAAEREKRFGLAGTPN